jgi:hypothetical protein
MQCLLTIRRLKPGTFEEFRKDWAPERWHGRMLRAYHLRSQDDPDEVITFALFEGTDEEVEAMRDDPKWMAGEERRLRRISALEESVLASGVYDVIDEIVPITRS